MLIKGNFRVDSGKDSRSIFSIGEVEEEINFEADKRMLCSVGS